MWKAVFSDASKKVMEEYLPQVRRIMVEQVSPAVVAAARAQAENDKLMKTLAQAIYDLLPAPVRRFVKEEAFVAWCLRHRDRLLAAEGTAVGTPPLQGFEPAGDGGASEENAGDDE